MYLVRCTPIFIEGCKGCKKERQKHTQSRWAECCALGAWPRMLLSGAERTANERRTNNRPMKKGHKKTTKMKTLKDIQNDERHERACRIERKNSWLKLASRMERVSDYGIKEIKRAYGKVVIFPDAYLAVNNDGVEMTFEKYAECLSWLCGRKIGRA